MAAAGCAVTRLHVGQGHVASGAEGNRLALLV